VAGVAAALVPVLFAFGGWQQALWMGGEVRDPERNLPRAILIGVAIVVAVYLSVAWAYFDLLGYDGVASSKVVAADAVGAVHGHTGRRAVAAAVAVSALGVLNAQLLTGPRLLYALARDGRFYAWFGRVDARRGTPVPAILLLAGTAIVLLAVAGKGGVDKLTTGVVMIDAVFFGLTGIASLVLARRQPHQTRPVRMPGYPFVPIAFGIAEFGVVVGAFLDPELRAAAWIGLAWMLAALLVYGVGFRKR
jgi:APA family basic amino acid/polyamine antiporter